MNALRSLKRQRGAVAVLVGLLFVFVLIGVAGIVLDLGRLFVSKTELQNAADACALAAARELNVPSRTLAVLTRAENAGITVGNRHRSDFQNVPVLFESDQDVTFSETLTGAYVTKGAASPNVRYARCTRRIAGYFQWFPQLLWLGGTTTVQSPVGATAVATLQGGATACAIPLAMCSQAAPSPCTVPGGTLDRFGLCIGQWYSGALGAHNAITGNFNWVDFTPHGGGVGEIEDALAGPGVCDVDTSRAVEHAEPGNMTALREGWNSRFGLYRPGGGHLDADSAIPDFTGHAYGPTNWPQSQLAYPDYLTKQTSYAPYPGDGVTGLDTRNPRFNPISRAEHALGGDRRVVSMPIVNCATWGSGHAATVSGWACALMVQTWPESPTGVLKLEYLGEVGVAGVPCATYGQSGGPGGFGPRVPTLVQ